MKKMRAAVAMSGGVDSSVAAALLKEQNIDVCGLTFKMFDRNGFFKDGEKPCIADADTESASAVAAKLNIPYRIVNYSADFQNTVVKDFIDTYKSGGTPNPCVVCNKYIKFGALLSLAVESGYEKFATGHYARIECENGRYILKRAADRTKDQTYVLYTLTQETLSHVLLPLGGYTKKEIREIAASLGFGNADRSDSQDICFIPDGDYIGFIELYTGKPDIPGNFVDCDGNILGRHHGITHYTVGQGKKLGIALGKKVFVNNIDPESGNIMLGDDSELYRNSLDAVNINLISIPTLESRLRVTAKIRYGTREASAYVWQTGEDSIHVEFDEPQRAITRGQSVVLYDGDVVIGGGRII